MTLSKTAILLLVVLSSMSACQHKPSNSKGSSKGFIDFKQKSYSFGHLKHGDVVGHRFWFLNTGTEPVAILHVEKSCGCTDVNYPKHLVMPGDSAFVELVFDSNGWYGRQVKQAKVITNDSEGEKELRIWADIQ